MKKIEENNIGIDGIDGIEVTYESKTAFYSSSTNIMWLIIDGWQMPINIHFSIDDNVFDPGKIDFGVWINTNVAEQI